MNIYELTTEWTSIQSALIEGEGELTPELEEMLDELEGATDAKANAYASVIKNLDGLMKARKVEAKRLIAIFVTSSPSPGTLSLSSSILYCPLSVL